MLPVSDFKYRYSNSERNTTQKTSEFFQLGKIQVKILGVSCFMFFSLVFAQLVFANNLATDGEKLSKIYKQIDTLQAENTQLKAQIAQNSAFSNLEKEAKSQGFQKPSKVINP